MPERLSAATGADRGLDAEIAKLIGAVQWHTPPAYTASLDAAMTLVPEGWIWDVTSTGTAWTMPDDLDGELHYPAEGATPALALCIAALRSRAKAT